MEKPKILFKNQEVENIIQTWINDLKNFGNEEKTINEKFGRILKLVGITGDETYIIEKLAEKKNWFYCQSENSNKTFFIKLRPKDTWDYSEITIRTDDESKTYQYIPEHATQLILKNYTKKNKDNGLRIQHSIDDFTTSYLITDEENTLYIDIDLPNQLKEEQVWLNKEELEKLLSSITFPINTNELYKQITNQLKEEQVWLNKEELEKLLSSITFPIKINELYKQIVNQLKENISAYPSFVIRVTKKSPNKKEEKTTEHMKLQYGKLIDFSRIKNERRITITSNYYDWSSEKDGVYINFTVDGELDYIIPSQNQKILRHMNIPQSVEIAKKEIEETKVYVKTIFENNKIPK